MREVVLDTETTGLDPNAGHRIVEIGCVELLNHVPTGRIYQTFLNPERAMPAEAFAVHGLSDEFLADKPLFAGIAEALATFLGDSPLIIHNAAFDLGFLNAERSRLGLELLAPTRAIDTVKMARGRFPGAPASLDALCKRFDIDLSDRTLHGALKDARLLAEVYLQLRGGREPGLALASPAARARLASRPTGRVPRLLEPTAEEIAAHRAFLERVPKALWLAET